MDLVLHIADEYMLHSLWARLSGWPRDYIPRQLLSLTMVTLIGINLVYFIFATISFQFIFNHELMRHPRFFKNQIRFEIQTSLKTIPATTLLMHHHKLIIYPVEAYMQALSYYLLVFLFPLYRGLYMGLFVLANVWSIFLHDSELITGHPLEHYERSLAPTLHHLYFTVNYGQYLTWADRVAGSYRHPESHLDPLLEVAKEKIS
ncbi:hypothetical protein OG21DRAFT_1597818 [Imleria badia]|nr:hypothetical protein OG21DRAFT_1597818 [Imleria badia]